MTMLRAGFAIALTITLASLQAQAFSGGVTSNSFFTPEQGCESCHGGGMEPTIEVIGPTVVAPSSTTEYTLRIFEIGSQSHAGFNAASPDGTLAVGGSASGGTQALTNGVSTLDEVTHFGAKAAAGGVTEFSFVWTAPAIFTDAVLTIWGNAVNFNSNTAGDAADVIELTVYNSLFDTPTATPTATATATPTPAMLCEDNIAPLNPDPINNADLRKCQEFIAKAGGLYVKKKIKAVQKCMNDFHKGKVTGDPAIECRGTISTLPANAKTADKITKATTKVQELIAKKCDDALISQLDTCDTTLAGVQTCLVDDHWQVTDDLVGIQYGDLFASTVSEEQKCQKTIGKEGTKFVTKALKAMQKCINARNKDESGVDAAALCIGAVAGGTYTAPTDLKTEDKVGKAETKLGDKLGLKCTDVELAALDSCASTTTGEVDCITCSHREAVFSLLETQYGGN